MKIKVQGIKQCLLQTPRSIMFSALKLAAAWSVYSSFFNQLNCCCSHSRGKHAWKCTLTITDWSDRSGFYLETVFQPCCYWNRCCCRSHDLAISVHALINRAVLLRLHVSAHLPLKRFLAEQSSCVIGSICNSVFHSVLSESTSRSACSLRNVVISLASVF